MAQLQTEALHYCMSYSIHLMLLVWLTADAAAIAAYPFVHFWGSVCYHDFVILFQTTTLTKENSVQTKEKRATLQQQQQK